MEEIKPLQNRHLLYMIIGKITMRLHDYFGALRWFSMGLAQLQSFNCPPQFAAPFLLDRAECFWRLGDIQASLQDMENALRHGLPRDNIVVEEAVLLASNIALYFHSSPRARAQAWLCKALAQHKMGKTTGARREINETKRLDGDLAREAERWKERGNELSKEANSLDLAIACYTLALKFTPAHEKDLRATILSNRCLMYIKRGKTEEALKDAQDCVYSKPDWAKAQYCQGSSLFARKKYNEAMEPFSRSLQLSLSDSSSSEHDKVDTLTQLLSVALKLPEETSALTAPVPSQLLNKLTLNVIKTRDWHKLRILYLGGGGPTSQAIGDGGLATGIDASSVPLGEIICSSIPERLPLISALLKHGASANAIEGSDVVPLDEAIRLQNLPLVEKLVHHGANPCVVGKDGEPIIHKALRIGLLNDGTFRFLEAMLASKIPEIENVQDANGDSLYHLACYGKKSTANKCKAIRILRDANVNPNLPNKRKKYPIEMLSKSDPRREMLKIALESYESNTSPYFQSETEAESASNEEQHQELLFSTTEGEDSSELSDFQLTQEVASTSAKDIKVSKVEDKQQFPNRMRRNVASLIDALLPLTAFVQMNKNYEQGDNESFNQPSEPQQKTGNVDELLKDEDEIILDPLEEDDAVADGDNIGDQDAEADIDSKSPFEDLRWEVECTGRVWKVLRSKKVDNCTRRRIIEKIRTLANGRWNKTMCRRLEGEAKKEGIQLYESKLTKSQRIIWEKTIAFSGRCSENPELRLNIGNPEGRIYSDIIRVWDIVLDHDKLQRSIEHIVKSHDRGMDCIIKTKLERITVEARSDTTSSSECLPNKYAELADLEKPADNPLVKKDAPRKPTLSNDLPQIFFPPAGANEQEYHILKFYSFSTALVKTVLESDTSTKMDFPFKITELEHAIVNLRPDPPIPIILLGRSGTGKTTCCLYRLWDNFQRYWESAVTAGPHIPRYVPPVGDTRGDEEKNLQSTTDEDQAVCGRGRISLASECQQFDARVDTGLGSAVQENTYLGLYTSHLPKDEDQCEENIPEEMNQPQLYEHLHQVFITKNTVLCSEVEKNFKELCHACPAAEHRKPFEDQPIPTKIQDVDEEAWPLFVNSRDWLLMLDASLPGESFFKRAADGSLLRKIDGWGEEDNHLQFIPATESGDESDNEEDEGVPGIGKGSEETKERRKETVKEERDPRREITYQVFQAEIWPKMKKSSKEKIDYHPTLVWTEIRSFIKGSAEALLFENGVLSLNDYESIGKKKAPNFSADRKVVYDLFRVYQRIHSSNRMFDEADLVFNIHRRLQSIRAPEWSVHQFYVAETQDFTQAELSLLIRCCRFPNNLFFTGDSAQSIMRGIAFRFDDLKSLFHHAKKAAGIREDHHDFIRVPKRLYQLTHNYRSHAGILRLASSVVDLLLHYFRDSFDRLQKDQGLFEGPKPVLLESCSPTDLAMILQGNQRQSSRIEFGARQVVLVASNEARETMPDELKHGLVMTIYEAKGLEFDDVLIYNFFKDSQAGKEWRVVTSFMEHQRMENVASSTGLVEITEESVNVQRYRPLDFDPEKHKVLNAEFKYLYTAITRARVNVWFYDEDEESRGPVFEYFQRLGLVKVVAIGDCETGSGELASMFAAKSTPEEWQKEGMRFYRQRLWVAALQCFTFAGDKLMLQKSQAQQQAAEASKFRFTNRQQMRDEFLRAAESFLKCDMYDEAEICLNNAKEWILLAKLYEKTGKFQNAARLFKKKGHYKEASKCYESQNNYAEAIDTLCQASLYEEALGAIERFNILSKSGKGRQGVIPPRPTHTVERLRHQLVDQLFKREKKTVLQESRKGEQYLTNTNVESVGIVTSKERKTVLQNTRKGNQCFMNTNVESVGIVTSKGGMVVAKGVRVTCPPGAITTSESPLTIKITVEEPSKHYGLIVRKGLQNDVAFGAPIIDLQPNGQLFQKPVIVRTMLDAGEANCTIKFIILHGTKAESGKVIWQDVSHNSKFDEEKSEVRIEIDRFSLIAVLRLLRSTLILTKDIVSRFNLLSFNYTLTVLFKANHPHSRYGELALVFMSQDICHEEYYREHDNSALMQLKRDGFQELCSEDGQESNKIHNKENLEVFVHLGEDYQLADTPQEGSFPVSVDSPVWWSTGLVIKLPLQGSGEVRILCGRIRVHGQYGHASEYQFCEQDLCCYVRRLLEGESAVFNLIPVGIKLGLSKETLTEVVESCKDEEDQLKVMLQHWQKGQGDTEDPAVLKEALDGLEPQNCRVKERGQMHIHHLRELSNKILDTKHKDLELIKYFTDQIQNLCTSVLRDCCIEIARPQDDVETPAPLHIENSVRFLTIHRKISTEDARKYQQMCASSTKPQTENFLQTVPFLIQTIKDIFRDEGISNVQNGLWGLSESTISKLASDVLGAVRIRNIYKLFGEVLEILEQLCLFNRGSRSTEEIKEWASGGGMLYMLSVLKNFFTNCEEKKLYKRLQIFAGFMKKIWQDPNAFDEIFIRDVHNVSLSLVRFAKFDPTKLVRFELVNSVTKLPHGTDNSEDVMYDDQDTFSQQFRIRKHSDDELQLDARALVHQDGKVRQVGAFRSVIVIPATSEEAFDKCQISDLPVAVIKHSESEELRVVLCATKRGNILKALYLLKSKLGEDEIDLQQTEITASPLTVLTAAEEETVVSLRLVYKWRSEEFAVESKDFVALVDSTSSERVCSPRNLQMADSRSSMEDELSADIVPLPRNANLEVLQRQAHREGRPFELHVHTHMHQNILKGHVCVAGENTSLNMQMPNIDRSHLQALPSVSSQRSIEGPCSREQTPSED